MPNVAPPAGWYAAEFDDSAWPVSVAASGPAAIPGAENIWTAEDGGTEDDDQIALFRRTFTLPAGAITSARLRLGIDNPAEDLVYVNGIRLTPVLVGSLYEVHGGALVAALLPGRANVLAMLGKTSPGGRTSFRLDTNGGA